MTNPHPSDPTPAKAQPRKRRRKMRGVSRAFLDEINGLHRRWPEELAAWIRAGCQIWP